MQGNKSIFFRYCLICFIGVSTRCTTFSQNGNQLVFRKIDEQNGLSDNDVQCVYKDSRNFVWIGTTSGLNLLDGSSITVYKNEPASNNSISNNNIQVIEEDQKGLMWIGTHEGLNVFNPINNKFNTVSLNDYSNHKSANIQSLAVDIKNNIYIGTTSGLYVYNSLIKKIIPILLPGSGEDSIRNNRINHIAFDHSGKLWIATNNGLWSYLQATHKTVHEISAENDPLYKPIFNRFIIDHAGKIWAGSWNQYLIEFDPASKKVTNHYIPDIENILSIAEIKEPNQNYILWLNGKGIGFDPSTNTAIHFLQSAGQADFPDALNLYTSTDNWLWIGTLKGLYYYNPAKTLIKVRLFASKITPQSISLAEWNQQLLVSGSDSSFLKSFDSNLNEIKNYSGKIIKQNISCLSLQQVSKNSFIAGTTSGITSINLVTGNIKLNQLQFLQKEKASGNFINSLLQDRTGNWWLFPWRKGIWTAYPGFKNMHQVFNNFLTENGIPKPLVISQAVVDDNDNLWFADLDEGIISYNRKTGLFSKPFEKQLGAKYNTLQILYLKNYCYSFSGNSFFKWKEDASDFKIFKLPAQLDKPIVSIAMDSIGRLWLATGKGLVVYNFTTNSFERFTIADGLVTNNMDGTLYCKKNGTMIFGSPNYLLSFDPNQMLASIDKKPGLQLEEVIVNGNPVLFDTSKRKVYNYVQNNFVFKWSVTDYNNPFNNRYYYLLKGVDNDWRDNGSRGQINFPNLSSAKYTLLLKGENSNEVNANRIITLQFEILSPFWKRWWFLSLIVLLILIAFYALYRYRLRQALKLEKLRNKISLDLHDDIGSTLSSISILSEMALRENKSPEKSSMLHEIKENSISLMEKMDDIVWSINPAKDSLGNLFVRIKTFAARLFEAKEISYRIEIEDDLKPVRLSMQTRQHIYLIMKEAINNLVKYSDCTEAEIKVSLAMNHLKILIHDNGKGFDKTQESLGNGIHSMKKRAEEMKANLEIDTYKNKGTTVLLLVKIK